MNGTLQTVEVAAAKPYRVEIGRGVLKTCGESIRRVTKAKRIAVITDTTVEALYAPTVCESLAQAGFTVSKFAFAPGETHKTLETIGEILDFLTKNGLTRSDCIVALGGGIVGDVAGFAASIYLRGISVIQLPTTFLAAIDSSVGGKTGVNLPAGKNLAGAFWQPSYVLCDCGCFATLPQERFLDGVAEAVKYGVIADDALFAKLEAGALETDLEAICARCVQIKSEFVAADEFDRGLRQILNLGHTLGHAVEKCSDYAVTHGHAVAIGMVAAAKTAARLGLCAEEVGDRIYDLLTRLGLPTSTEIPVATLAAVMRGDKKAAGDAITLVLPAKIGECVLHPVPLSSLETVFSATKRD
ncbi:MAG: 3-dehydroquinate synthase [Clostridia bacterium]|nr:3-dehydroquinate synthase [Clostridia bacterium]